MPPKTKFDKEKILEAAFEIARQKGLSGITARSVAQYLGCSVAPIYGHFNTINDLVAAVCMHVFRLSEEMLSRQEGDNLFEKIGKASLEFARKYPVFLYELVVKKNPYMASYEAVENKMLKALAKDRSMPGLSKDEQKALLLKMKIFQTGSAVMIANEDVPPWITEKALEELLLEVGHDLLSIQKMKRKEKKA